MPLFSNMLSNNNVVARYEAKWFCLQICADFALREYQAEKRQEGIPYCECVKAKRAKQSKTRIR